MSELPENAVSTPAPSDSYDSSKITVLRGPDGRRRLVLALTDRAFERTPSRAHDLSIGAFTDGLDLADVPARGAEAQGVDTWADLRDLRGTGPA